MSSSQPHRDHRHHRRREATVYDAVAGRIGLSGFIRQRSTSLRQVALPIEVLFRRRRAPLHARRVFAVDRSDGACVEMNLPESDLLKAVHVCFSEGFEEGVRMAGEKKRRGRGRGRSRGRVRGIWEDRGEGDEEEGEGRGEGEGEGEGEGRGEGEDEVEVEVEVNGERGSRRRKNMFSRDWRSMDETALLALGILLEEAAADGLDELGYRKFTELDPADGGGRCGDGEEREVVRMQNMQRERTVSPLVGGSKRKYVEVEEAG